MRLSASQLSQLTPEILHDLSRLGLPVPSEAIAGWLEHAGQAWIATFNNKVIALAIAHQSGMDYTLDFLSVREATRRRGVGCYLLQELTNALPDSVQLLDSQSERLEGVELAQWHQFLAACDWQQNVTGQWFRP